MNFIENYTIFLFVFLGVALFLAIDFLIISIILKKKVRQKVELLSIELHRRKKSEEILSEKEKMFRIIADYSNEWEYWIDENGTLLWVNSAVEKITGISATLCYKIKDYPFTLIHHQDREMVREIFRNAFNDRTEGVSFDFRVVNTKSDKTKWVCAIWQSVFDENHSFKGIRWSIEDVTKRVHAEEKLNYTKNLLQNVMDSLPVAIVGFNNDSQPVIQNEKAKERFKNQDITRTKIIYHFSDIESILFDAINNKKVKVLKGVESFVGDKIVYEDITLIPMTVGDGFVLVFDDITERVKINELMIQSEKMVSIGGLAAGMAHEINNPLGGIMMGVQNVIRWLSKDFAKNYEIAKDCNTDFENIVKYCDERKIVNTLESVMISGKRAADIVANMLDFSRKSDLKHSYENLIMLIQNAVDLAKNDYDMKKRYDFRGIKVSIEHENSTCFVRCSRTEIEQVVFNLLKNSVQAIFYAQTQNPQIDIVTKKDEDKVLLKISDNGPGISKEAKKRILEPFYTTQEIGEGTGLGLSVAYYIVTNNHKGAMDVYSKEGEGTVVQISLPL